MFAGRRLCIATMHRKETVIAPVLQRELGVQCITCSGLNTDLLGTFSGEIERVLSPLEAARQKCIQSMTLTGCDLAVSSEGSFGAHPVIGFIPCDDEIILFCDKKNALEIVVRELSTQTNFSDGNIENLHDLRVFAKQIQFPSHGLIVKDAHGNVVAKGIRDWDQLETQFEATKSKGLPVKVETDMRAHQNPTRMSVIETCTRKLVAAIKSECPACRRPGFVVSEAEPGLPCKHCSMPTRSTLKHIKICQGCAHRQEIPYPHLKQFEEPDYCDFCNP